MLSSRSQQAFHFKLTLFRKGFLFSINTWKTFLERFPCLAVFQKCREPHDKKLVLKFNSCRASRVLKISHKLRKLFFFLRYHKIKRGFVYMLFWILISSPKRRTTPPKKKLRMLDRKLCRPKLTALQVIFSCMFEFFCLSYLLLCGFISFEKHMCSFVLVLRQEKIKSSSQNSYKKWKLDLKHSFAFPFFRNGFCYLQHFWGRDQEKIQLIETLRHQKMSTAVQQAITV